MPKWIMFMRLAGMAAVMFNLALSAYNKELYWCLWYLGILIFITEVTHID